MNLEHLQWISVIIGLTLIITMFGFGILQSGVKAAVESNAPLVAREIAGIINVIQTAPDGTTHTYVLPKMGCKIFIQENFIRLETDDGVYRESLISHVSVRTAEINCDKQKQKTLVFVN